MPQRKKDDVRERMLEAAARVFAEQGYRRATMAGIAEAAGVATGNLYHYFPSKAALFSGVIPESFVDELFALMTRKVRALDGVDDMQTLPAGAEYHELGIVLTNFCVANRLRMIILASGTSGSPLAEVPDRIVGLLKSLALEHFRSVLPAFAPSRVQRQALDWTYRNWIAGLSAALRKNRKERDIREALDLLTRYHLAGLRAMFALAPEQVMRQERRE